MDDLSTVLSPVLEYHARRIAELRENTELISTISSIANGRMPSDELEKRLCGSSYSKDKRFYHAGRHQFNDGAIDVGVMVGDIAPFHWHTQFLMYVIATSLLQERWGEALTLRTYQLMGLLSVGNGVGMVLEDFGRVDAVDPGTSHPQAEEVLNGTSELYFRGKGGELIAGDLECEANPQYVRRAEELCLLLLGNIDRFRIMP